MTARVLPRELGTVLLCSTICGAKLVTGQVGVKLIRGYATSLGWIRGGAGDRESPSRKRWDICPACAPAERERIATIAKRKAERARGSRCRAWKARADLKTALPKRQRKPRAAQEASAKA